MHIRQLLTDEEKHQRFVKTFDEYRKNGLIKDVKEFCSDIEYATPTLWKVLSNQRIVPNHLIYKFCEFFKLDPAYFFGRSKELKSWREIIQLEMKNDIEKIISKY